MKNTRHRFALILSLLCVAPLASSAVTRYLSGPRFERMVLAELNRVRADPAGYARYLATLRGRYGADGVYARPGELSIRTKEGVSALEEAIRALRNTAPLPALSACEPLTKAARAHAAEQSRSGAVGHGSSPFARLSRHGEWLDAAGENIAYGSTTPERVVADLIIDDGQRQRGHRANILNPAYRVAGVGIDRHPRYGVVCVIDFAGRFEAR